MRFLDAQRRNGLIINLPNKTRIDRRTSLLTLADLNAKSHDRQWDRYTLRTEYVIGRYGRVGTHLHLVQVEVVVKEEGEHKPGTYSVGQVFSSEPLCNSRRGQHGAKPFMDKRWDTKDVTCKKCRVIIGGQ